MDVLLLLVCLALIGACSSAFRPPAVPLVVNNPYMSIWSAADNLYDEFPMHWSGDIMGLTGLIRIDGKTYRYMGPETLLRGSSIPNVEQAEVAVGPTTTYYVFHQDGVKLDVIFFSGSAMAVDILDDTNLSQFEIPVTYLNLSVSSEDGKVHHVQLYYDNSAEPAVMNSKEMVTWSRNRSAVEGHHTMSIGTVDQKYLQQGSDRINWGYWYTSVEDNGNVSTVITSDVNARGSFANGRAFPDEDDKPPRACEDNWPVLAVSWDLGNVGKDNAASRYIVLAYDQVVSIRYFGHNMIPFWRHLYNNDTAEMLRSAHGNATALGLECLLADGFFMTMISRYINPAENYSAIATLAWRQTVGGTQLVWNDILQQEWVFLKEISSGGAVNTVDVLYPASPLLVYLFSTQLQKLLMPILAYANNETKAYGEYIPYNLTWAPHHLGHWPICDLAPNHQEQMPMEETGNMLIMIAAIAKRNRNKEKQGFQSQPGSLTYLKPYWPLLRRWGDYLVSNLPDPGNQLCTDDFEGPSPHNANLAIKGIVGLGALAYLLEQDGQKDIATHYLMQAKNFVTMWMKNASDGDHYRMQYNLPDTWSLKYNLLYDRYLGLNLFPQSVYDLECAYYQKKMNAYGVPLDNRADFTKTDWLMWIASICNHDQFDAITNSVYRFADMSPDRVPFSDWYFTTTGKVKGFRARPVVGGIFAAMLFIT
ncbi:uncharacterized protein LOC134179036 [Corticium candelabrum]|uniref:uncharacterized protein LOC134179036 n=1 Tax=Corticium candelabrum TaxID=121492 RepID=UPI002E27468D|nr:uncharacterized protein LOC134179036 [Corticium candelabrum]